jgi:hypothetical protein
MMASAPANLIKTFPDATLTKLGNNVKDPTFATMQVVQVKLNTTLI